jgi:hypothetical protein
MRRTLLALLVLCLAAGLTGCGGVAEAIDPVAGAATKSEQAGSGRVSMSIDVGVDGKTSTITGTGSFARDRGQMTIDMSSLLERAQLPAGGGDVEILYLKEAGNRVMYVRVPSLSGQIPGGKSWVRLNLEQASKAMGFDLGEALGPTDQNPGEVLAMLRANAKLDEVGKETLDGTQTTHYKGTLDLDEVAKQKGVSPETLRHLKATGASTQLPMEVWVGDDGLVRQVKMLEELTTGGKKASASVTIGFSDYGADVSVTAPPSDQVFDLTALAELAGTKTTTA